MIHEDTIRLLRECNAGVKMGVSAIDEVLDKVSNSELRTLLTHAEEAHTKLGNETHSLLEKYHDDGKEPNPMAKSMSWMKTNMKMAMNETDNTIADLMTDGCNMGVKSLCKYLNQYAAADEQSKNITKELIRVEEDMAACLRQYL